MARVPDPNDSRHAQVGKRKPTTRAEWRSSASACRSLRDLSIVRTLLEIAIVRERPIHPSPNDSCKFCQIGQW